MNVLHLIWKDLKITTRNPKTVILIAVGPMIIILLVGLLFIPSTTWDKRELSSIQIGICDMDGSNLSSMMSSEIEKTFNVKYKALGNPNCETILENMLKENKLIGMVVIPSGFQKNIENGEHQKVWIKINNGDPQISYITASIISEMVSQISKSMSGNFVSNTWDKLNEMSENLDKLIGDLDYREHEIHLLLYNINNTDKKLQNINTQTIRSNVEYLKQRVTQLKNEVKSYGQDIDEYLTYIDELDEELSQTSTILSKIDSDLLKTKNNLIKTKADLQDVYDEGYCDHKDDPEFQNSPNFIVQKWISLCNNIQETIYDINLILSDIDTHRDNVASLQSKIVSGKATLSKIRNKLIDLREKLNDTSELEESEQKFNEMRDVLDQFSETRIEAQQTVEEVKSMMHKMNLNINALQKNVITSRNTLSTLVKRSPKSVVTPIGTKTTSLFKRFQYMDAYFPTVLAIIIMFVSVLFSSLSLIKERRKGTLKRLLSAPTRTTSIILSKVAITWLITIVQVLFLVGVAFLLFDVKINLQTLPFTFVIVSLLIWVSSVIGIIIAVLSRSENTAILASLVVCIPLMFLTGVFFPWQFMLPIMRLIAMFSPLTHATRTLNILLIYTVGTNNVIDILITCSYLSFLGFVGLIVASILLKKIH